MQIIVTKDGSHSLLHEALNETYHSLHGAMQESVHVFIQQGLQYYLRQHPGNKVSILEVGFGTGLNALLTLQHAQQLSTPLAYVTLEAYPLEEALWSKLNYTDSLGLQPYFEKLHRTAWNEEHVLLPHVSFTKLHTTLQAVTLAEASFDIVYFDAFAPNKQPEMWTLPVLEKVTGSLKQGGILVTYCAKGQLKRDLKTLGLTVETLSGPPGKKEMVRAVKC